MSKRQVFIRDPIGSARSVFFTTPGDYEREGIRSRQVGQLFNSWEKGLLFFAFRNAPEPFKNLETRNGDTPTWETMRSWLIEAGEASDRLDLAISKQATDVAERDA